MNITQLYVQTWAEARTRLENLLRDLTEEDLTKKLITIKSVGYHFAVG